MKRVLFFVLILLAALVFIACKSPERVPHQPGFVTWCYECERYTTWEVAEDYFFCSNSGTIWDPASENEKQEIKP